jgi:hypothetical protein
LSHLIELDNISLEDWLKSNGKLLGKTVGAAAREAVRDWFFELENYPTDCSLLSAFFAADSVYLRLSNIQPTGVLIPRILRYVLCLLCRHFSTYTCSTDSCRRYCAPVPIQI